MAKTSNCHRILQIMPAPANLRAVWRADGEKIYAPVVCLALVESWVVPEGVPVSDRRRSEPDEDVKNVWRTVEPITISDLGLDLCSADSNYEGVEFTPSAAEVPVTTSEA
ncbi:MAG: hypothetical protein ABJA98_21180 [Acidobacteriota bacterium]